MRFRSPDWALLALTLVPGLAAGQCIRPDAIDPESPPGLAGKYEIVGRDAVTGKPYAGSIILGNGTRSYSVVRIIGSKQLRGEAWLQTCGMDKIVSLRVTYQSKPGATQLSCTINGDGDNYYRMTCRTRADGARPGLEAWFQTQ